MLVKKKLLELPILEAPETTKIDETEWSAGADITEGILHIDIYFQNQLQYRFFSDNKNYIFYLPASNEWKNKCVFACSSDYYWYGNHIPRIKSLDYYKVKEFTEFTDYGHSNISSLVDSIIRSVRSDKKERRENSIEVKRVFHLSKIIPENAIFSESVKEQLNEILNKHLIVSKAKRGKRNGICGCCGQKMEINFNVRHKEILKCPVCNNLVQIVKESFADSILEKERVCYVDERDGIVSFRYSTVERRINSKGEYSFSEYLNKVIVMDKYRGKRKDYAYYISSSWYSCGVWTRAKGNIFGEESFTLINNIKRIFGVKNRLNIEQVVRNTDRIDIYSLLERVEKMPELEYLYKGRFYNLAAEISTSDIYKNTKNIGDALGIDHNSINTFRNVNIHRIELLAYRTLGYNLTKDTILELRKCEIARLIYEYNNLHINNNITLLTDNINLNNFANYVKRIGLYDKKDLRTYLDYLSLCNSLEIDISVKSVKFPKDIRLAHDRLVGKYNALQKEISKIKSIELARWVNDLGLSNFNDDNYCIKVPLSHAELIREGEVLSHCVGINKYWNNHNAKKSMIFFVRKIDDENTPFVTMEINMETFNIVQIYGDHDKPPASDVKKFGREYSRFVGKQVNKYIKKMNKEVNYDKAM